MALYKYISLRKLERVPIMEIKVAEISVSTILEEENIMRYKSNSFLKL